MAQATDGEISQYPNQIRGEIFFQRDLLQRLMTGKCRNNKEPPPSPDEEPSDVELNLGLSLGGCFAAEQKENKLVRSSSIADPATVWRLPESVGLVRSCSVPANLLPESLERSMEPGIVATAAEDRRRRRMELHALKRKRWMGLEGCRVKDRAGWGGDGGKQGGLGKGESFEEDKEEDEEETLTLTLMGGKREGCTGAAGGQPPQHGIGNGVSFPYMVPGAGWTGGLNLNGKTGAFMPVASSAFVPASHASLGSQGSSSSGVSEFESKPAQGLNGSTDARSPASVQSLPEQSEQKVIPGMGTAKISGKAAGEEADNLSRKRKMSNAERNVMEEMPCVSTRGEGPNGKRIEGFLYNFKKGEEVRIVCVCHGSFLSPAEFVKHGGGGDVAHPLRHIVVNPSPSFFL